MNASSASATIFARAVFVLLALFALASAGCAPPPKTPFPPNAKAPFSGYDSPLYRDPAKWICIPGRDDACSGELDATELRADGTRVLEESPRRKPNESGKEKIDCFYVYPTVDLSLSADNHEDLAKPGKMAAVTITQAAKFRDVCNVYAPLYRQMTIGAYMQGKGTMERHAAVAESDVVDAFMHYMGQWNRGHKIVLIGHSQGAEMVHRIVARFFDNDPDMRARLVYAFIIGGEIHVERGGARGGSFSHIPLCTSADESGCIIAFRSYAEGAAFPIPLRTLPSSLEDACVSPATLLGNDRDRLSGVYFPLIGSTRRVMRGVENIDTPFVLLRDYYRATCKRGENGFRYLSIAKLPDDDDVRVDAARIDSAFWKNFMGLHILDVQFTLGDLIELVGRRAAALP